MSARLRSGVILLLLGFVLLRFSQPYVTSYQFQRLVEQEVQHVQPRAASAVHQRILEQGRALGLKIGPPDILVERLVRGYRVSVKYAVPLDLKVYRTDLEFTTDARTTTE